MNLLLVISFISLAICLLLIVLLFISLSKQGDERQKFIKEKTTSGTFYVSIILLIVQFVKMLYTEFYLDEVYKGINPLSFLVGITFAYFILLLLNKRRFGA